ncbi:hypothetical protein [Pseudomonas lundensis]|uniref:hypothetical protein n=1 Tax=Pseudomonas lundensis TaxID=86185 RepID=UPI0014751828|nr:hypothetical protein [Pseudomonas lundensis]NNA39240.1 hypothetical protein [Pseudomonas lundensis]
MNKDEAFIRDCAARKYSKSMTARLLGMWPQQLDVLLEFLPMPKVEFVPGSQSAGAAYQRAGLHESRRGVKQDYLTDADRQRLRDRTREMAPKHTAFGVTGTIPELVARFGVVSLNSVRRRMKLRQMKLEQALTAPRADRDYALSRKDNHPWRKADEFSYQLHMDRQAARQSQQAPR